MSTRELGHAGERNGRAYLAPVPAFADDLSESEDKALTIAFKHGEKGAYQAIHDRYADRVHAVCRRMLLQREDAEEAAQESFLRVYQALGRFNGRYLLGPWITRITTNVCLDHLRAKGRRPVDLVPVEALDVHGHPDSELDPQEVHLHRTEGRRVRKLLESLPPMYRAAIVLRDFEGLSYSEIATTLEITESQTKALIHRARQAFKRSWSSALLALPLRFLNRARRIDPATRDSGQAATSVQHTSEVMGSAVHAANSCSTIIQQCGQFLADRGAAAATAVVIATAGVATVSPPAHTSPPETPIHEVAVSSPTPRDAAKLLTSATRPRDRIDEEAPVAEPAPESTPVAPAEEPATAPEDASGEEVAPEPAETPPADAGGSGNNPTPDPTQSPSPSPSPSPLPPSGFSFGFAVGGPAPPSACTCTGPTRVHTSEVGATSAGIERLDQVLSGSATSPSGDARFGAWVDHQSASGTSHAMEFRLYTNEGGYFYTATGTLVDRALLEWSGWRYTYRGTYRLTSRPGGSEQLTSSGTYVATVEVSWQENRVVSTEINVIDGGS